MGRTTDLSLADARALISRAIDKAEEIGMRGAVVVVGGTGALVSGSRMDHGGAGGMARAKSKAWIAATQQIPSTEHLGRMRMVAPPMVSGFTVCSPEAIFPGAGGMLIHAEEGPGRPVVVAGIAASGAGIGPFVNYPGAEQQKLIADGKPSNGEDLLVHYALGIPYVGQHGDDVERWMNAFGELPSGEEPGLGMAPAPPAQFQDEHKWALVLADRVIAAATERGVRISLAVVDRRGDPIQQDKMDGAVAASPDIAQTVATTAATLGIHSADVREVFSGAGVMEQLAKALPYAILSAPGGRPIVEDGEVVAGLGVAGDSPTVCAQIAADVLK